MLAMGQIKLRVTCPETMIQICPLCYAKRPMLVNGMVRNPEDISQLLVIPDKCYSYCDCKEIFFTNWKNIDQTIYDADYSRKYNGDGVDELFENYIRDFIPIFKENKKDIKSFAEIGCVNPKVLDGAKKEGWKTFAVDINPNSWFGEHESIVCDVERLDLGKKFDVIWASHIFEHFKDPLKVADNLHESLTDDGLLFVAMPDLYYLDLRNPYAWAHWSIREHYILWYMDSFVATMEDRRWKCVYKKHNSSKDYICNGDFHTIFKKVKDE